jgi:hypothetical protein
MKEYYQFQVLASCIVLNDVTMVWNLPAKDQLLDCAFDI